jgi:hypothetical protein
MFLSGLIYIYQLDSVDTEKLVQRTDNSWSGATLASAVIASKNPYSSLCVCVCLTSQVLAQKV